MAYYRDEKEALDWSRSGQRPQFDDIISGRPEFIMRWGNLLFVLTFISLTFVCWVVRYPQKVILDGKLFLKASTDRTTGCIPEGSSLPGPLSSQYYIKFTTAARDCDLIDVGQIVPSSIGRFPSLEYGVLCGYIESRAKSTSSTEAQFIVNLPDGLVTTSGITLPYTDDLTCHAEITIGEIRLLQMIL